MKLVFVYWGYENAGSMLDLRGYTRAARKPGHEVTIYGPPIRPSRSTIRKDLAGADAVVFVVEWTTAARSSATGSTGSGCSTPSPATAAS